MKKQLFTAFCLCLCLLYQGTLHATTENPCDIIYVKTDATGNNDGSSWSNAYTKLQDALLTGCACGGTTQIWVAAGIYYPDEGTGQTNNLRTSSFQLCNNKAVYGGFNGTETTLSQRNWITNVTTLSGDIDQTPTNNTGNAYHVVNASGTNNSSALDGFTITLGNANGTDPFNKGGGVYKDNGAAKFYNNKFLANSAAVGGGMFNLGGSIDIVKCIFENNNASVVTAAVGNNGAMTGTYKDCSFINNTTGIDQGGVGCQGVTLTFDNCVFIGNLVTGGSGAGGAFHAWASNITMRNTLFSGNKANRGGAIFVTFNTIIKLINVTGSGNWATANGGFIFGETNSNFLIDNSVVWNNRAGTVTTSTSASVFHSGSTATIKYSDIANSGGSGAWNAAIGTNGGNNIDVNPQFVLPVDPATAPTTAGNLQLTGFSPLHLGSNAAYDVVGDPQNDLDLGNNPRVFDYSNGGIIDMGAYEFQGQGSCPSGSIIYVKASASGANNGTSWTNAYTKLQDALFAGCACGGITQIWVAAGTYYPDEGTGQTNNLRTSSFQLCTNKAVYGGFNGTETTLSQRDWLANVTTLSGDIDQVAGLTNNAYHVLIGSGTGNTAILDGFTVTGGNANGGGANNNGGGMVNLSGSPTLRNMKFTGNQATTLGGAMHNSLSSPLIQNSIFLTNTSSVVGGAINAEVSSHMTVVDCDFISNTGTINGGAISLSQSNPVIRDCRFIGNTSQEGGGIYAFRMVSTLTNCLFSGNRATNRGAALHLTTDSNSKLLNCTISGNNSTGNGGGILLWNTPNLTVINTIIHNNQAAGSTTSTSASIFRDNATANFSYCLVANSGGSGSWNATIGNNGGNNVDTNPQFVLPVNPATAPTTAGNLQLTGFSPLNLGSNVAYDVVGDPQNDLDLANNPRVFDYSNGGIIDMGAYEFQGQSSCPGGSIVYVKASASGANNGTSWANAYTKLQDALLAGCSCTGITQIWVAAGTYYPDEGTGQTNNNRNSSFQLCNGKAVLGGFNGTETIVTQRNWEVNETILSGNIDGAASTGGNAYHVVLASNTNNTALLDGFTITEGNANGTVVPFNRGGGVYKENGAAKFQHIYFTLNLAGDGASYYSLAGSSTLTDCIFENNFGSVVVGGVINQASPAVITRCHFINNRGGIETAAIGNTAATVTIVDCSFIGNEAGVGNGNAGAIHSWSSTVNIYNCLFSGNKATRNGGAVFNTFNTVANIVNCTFSGNRTTLEGGAIFNEQNAIANVKNSIIWNNQAGSSTSSTSASIFNSTATTNVYYSLVANSGGSGGGWQNAIGVDGGNNIASDPLFVLNVNPATAPTLAGDLHVQTSSPAINAGNNSYNTQPFDLDGNARIANDVIDMGAFEHYIACTPITWYVDADGDGYGDPGFSIDSCDLPIGYVDNNQDCDDTAGDIHPGAEETCNDMDDDCDGLIDEDLQMYTYYQDADADGYGNELVFITSCDTVPQEGYVTAYGNGPFGGGGGEGGGGEGGGSGGNGGGDGENYFDSDDTNPFVNPGMPEICNGIDDDSDGLTDEGVMSVFYADADGDTYGNLLVDTMACTAPVGFVADSEDCDDTNPNINPGMQETCNGLDDDCDGLVDDADQGVIDQETWYADVDQDGYGNPADSVVTCFQPSGYIDNNEDCDDTNADIHPGAEVCNGLDDDCDGVVDDGLSCQGPDGDGDGIEDEEDNCVSTENPNQEDSDCDGVGDACDVCPGGDDGVDMDNDGLPDCHYLPAYADILSSWKCSANKVFIAHHSGGGGWNTLCVNYSAAQSHINHGDYLGPVSNSQCSQNFMVPGFEHDEVDANNAMLELFPNPTNEKITIHLHDIKGQSELTIVDQLGRVILHKSLQQGEEILQLDLGSMSCSNGIYYATINYSEGVLVSRFVVNK